MMESGDVWILAGVVLLLIILGYVLWKVMRQEDADKPENQA